MSRKTARRLLFAVALLTVPVPFYLGEPELAPVVRLVFLAALFVGVLVAEGGGTVGLLAGIGIAQVLVLGGLVFAGSALVGWSIQNLHTARLRNAVVAAVATGLLGISLAPIYHTPLSSARLYSNLFQLFE